MSVKIMSKVWEDAPYEGGTLLVLLALADWANDEGVSWPGVETLAGKARLGERQTRTILRSLESDGVLTTRIGGGRAKQNVYQINTANIAGFQLLETGQSATQRGQSTTETGQPTAPDPSVLDPLVDPKAYMQRSASPKEKPDPAHSTLNGNGSGNGSAAPKIAITPSFELSERVIRSLSKDCPNFDKGESLLRFKGWRRSRVRQKRKFASEAELLVDLEGYMETCSANK